MTSAVLLFIVKCCLILDPLVVSLVAYYFPGHGEGFSVPGSPEWMRFA